MKARRLILITFLIFILNTFLNPLSAYASGFSCNAYLTSDGKDIVIEWTGYERKFIDTGLNIKITQYDQNNLRIRDYLLGGGYVNESGKIYATKERIADGSKIKIPEDKTNRWKVKITNKHTNQTFTFNMATGSKPQTNNNRTTDSTAEASEDNINMAPIPVMPANSSKVVMFWYYTFATLTGVFVFLTIIRTGYQYIAQTDSNPGQRASTISTLQKCAAGFLIIMVAPLFVQVLIALNNGFVEMCLKGLNMMTSGGTDVEIKQALEQVGFFDKILATPFHVINNLICSLFGLSPIGILVFNEAPAATPLAATGFLTSSLKADGVNTGNPFADAILAMVLILFTLYFNIVYIIRHWVIIAVLAATPIIIWIWVLSQERNVIYLWFAELVQTIFIQSAHALTFAVVFSILCFNPGGAYSTEISRSFALILFSVGKFVAYFAGIIAVGFLVVQAYRMVVATDERVRADAKSKVGKIFIGVVVISLALMIASAITPESLSIHHVDLGDQKENKITIFQLIIGLAAVIPISKMFSMIFMNFLARVGTVDEFAFAGKATAGLAGLTVLASSIGKGWQGIRDLRGSSQTGGEPGSPGGFNPLVGGQVSEGAGRTYYAGGMVNETSAGREISGGYNFQAGTAGGGSYFGTTGYTGNTGGSFPGITGISGYSNNTEETMNSLTPSTSFYGETGFGSPAASDSGGSFNFDGMFSARTPEDVARERAESEKEKIRTMGLDTIKQAQKVGNVIGESAGGIGRGIGMVAGIAVPPMAKLAGDLGYASGKLVAPIATGTSLINQYYKSGAGSLKEYTGRTTALGAFTQMGTAVFTTAFSNSPQKAYQMSVNWGSKIDGFFAPKQQPNASTTNHLAP